MRGKQKLRKSTVRLCGQRYDRNLVCRESRMNDLIGPICLDAWRESISGRKNAQGAGELAALLPPALCPGSVHPTNFSAALKNRADI
ncbi:MULTISPECIES: hypothetical protein [Methanothrix]|uniref:Uncharacterized protein n=4 Tax=root TaxID=1 RepID=F4BU59_METSG|nr:MULTISPECIES: hypothetical protein [Methanothrix]NYT09772.1 hypothetical protein [Methanosarcinales archaeon]AEB68257.1 hypothetical protein MCON_1629 [Methanothrix soehngenii GP6]MBP7067617.1 hypothetical protein [Methanothrix sp.]NLJ21484.1 hypothetical protein [Methanothrix soehngenii]HOE44286.1 hypothetical protein [Methanothrix soehngenii]